MIQQGHTSRSHDIIETMEKMKNPNYPISDEAIKRAPIVQQSLHALIKTLGDERRALVTKTSDDIEYSYLLAAFICAIAAASSALLVIAALRSRHHQLSAKAIVPSDRHHHQSSAKTSSLSDIPSTDDGTVDAGVDGDQIAHIRHLIRGTKPLVLPVLHTTITECEYATCSDEDYPPASRYHPIRIDSAEMVAQMENHFEKSGFPLSCLVSNQTARDEYGIDINDENVAFCVVI